MNTIEEDGILHQHHGMLKQKFADLMEDDLLFQEGLHQETFGRFMARIGRTEEDLYRIIDTL
jgi:uncharacterized protein YjbJ (UPF0337 family)